MAKRNKIKQEEKFYPFLIKISLALRVITLISAWLGWKFLLFKYSFPYDELLWEKAGSPLLWSWANFDGFHYLILAKDGYIFGLTQAFFPVFPLLIRLSARLIRDYLVSGLLISHLAFLGMIIFFYKLIRLDFSQKISRRAIAALVLFPTAFFFLSFYTESLFLFFVLASFYCWRKKSWLMAGFLGALTAATKLVGIFLVPAFLYELRINKKKPFFPSLLGAILPLGGLVAYMSYLQMKFSDPLLFVHVQEEFGGGRKIDKFIFLHQVFWRYAKMIFTVDIHNPIYFTVWLELLTAMIFLGLLLGAWIKGVRKSYLIFAGLAYILPTLTGTFSSMPRYVLVLFPAFIMIGKIKSRFWYQAWLLVSIGLLIISTMLFTRGYWIA